ncbi:WD40 repeat domain-containing protein [Phototrophicus methaneseepsis]|uniref:WD40 repeat domain-containing protein n=1 Tax=Phototrophicus methaneseepsis TaxID=2710758 RepID=A0A7S8EBH4_9CHLR|nr:WD40 repeat domain-containing protein [Phototrophicus methaneseepsis]QPC83913.1 WD40 repeat domain-containing protein [Phototrophicus methaneseepsis]
MRVSLIIILLLWAVGHVTAQTTEPIPTATLLRPTLTPSPSAPGVFVPTPTPLPTAIEVGQTLPLPDLQPITRENARNIRQLFTLQCRRIGVQGAPPEIQDITFSPVGNRLAIILPELICIYDLDAPEIAAVVIEDTWGDPSAAFFSVDGRSLYNLQARDDVFKWNATTGEEEATELEGVYLWGVWQNIALSPEGTQLASGTRFWLQLWDMTSETLLAEANVGRVTAVAWHPDGTRLATIEAGRLGLYTVYEGSLLFRDALLPIMASDRHAGLAFGGADGNLLAYSNGNHVAVMDITSQDVVARVDINKTPFRQQVLVFSPADPYLLVGTGISTLWDVESDQGLIEDALEPCDGAMLMDHAAFNAQGTLLVLTDGDSIFVCGVPQ